MSFIFCNLHFINIPLPYFHWEKKAVPTGDFHTFCSVWRDQHGRRLRHYVIWMGWYEGWRLPSLPGVTGVGRACDGCRFLAKKNVLFSFSIFHVPSWCWKFPRCWLASAGRPETKDGPATFYGVPHCLKSK